jgi:hypothetical protein
MYNDELADQFEPQETQNHYHETTTTTFTQPVTVGNAESFIILMNDAFPATQGRLPTPELLDLFRFDVVTGAVQYAKDNYTKPHVYENFFQNKAVYFEINRYIRSKQVL